MSKIQEKKKEIQSEVNDLESDIENRISQLKQQVEDTLSVKGWVKKYPFETVGLAALAGFILAVNSSKTWHYGIKGFLLAEIKKQALNQVVKKVSEKFNTSE